MSLDGVKHVLVTGGAGYIGSTLVPLLLQNGLKVTVYDAFKYGVSPLLAVSQDPNLSLVKGDICDHEALAPLVAEADAIVHLAAIVGYPACDKDPEEAVRVNVQGTATIANLVTNQMLIYSSTGSCYGAIPDVCTEETPISPLTLYGRSKAAGECTVLAKKGVVLRLATLFGIAPRPRFDLLINELTHRAMNEKELAIYEPNFRRTFLHVRDAANAFLFAIKNYSLMSGSVYNVGDESMNMTKGEAVHRIKKYVVGTQIHLTADGKDLDQRNYEVSYKKLSKLGFRSSITVDEGILELIKVLPTMSLSEINFYRNHTYA